MQALQKLVLDDAYLSIQAHLKSTSEIFTLLGITELSLQVSFRIIQAFLLLKVLKYYHVCIVMRWRWIVCKELISQQISLLLLTMSYSAGGLVQFFLQLFQDFMHRKGESLGCAPVVPGIKGHLLLDLVDSMPVVRSAYVAYNEAFPSDALPACMKVHVAGGHETCPSV